MTVDTEHCRAVAQMIMDLCDEVDLLRRVANCAGCRSNERVCELLDTPGQCWRRNLNQEKPPNV